jgi:SAM-dependent methyltransferase
MHRALAFCLAVLAGIVLIAASARPYRGERQEAGQAYLIAGKETTVEQRTEKPRQPDVIFEATPQEVVDKMLELAEIKAGDVVYDLGCGDGRIVVTAAKQYGVKAFGYDIDPRRVKESLENVKKNQVDDLVTIKQADIFTLDLSGADVVTLYLLPQLNVKLMPQLKKLKPGSRIVSHDFDMKGAKPKKVVSVILKGNSHSHKIYLWTVPWEKE